MEKYSDRKIPMNELIYWIDKEFVQWRANEIIGREMDDEEIERTTKFIEHGLAGSVFEIIDISINEMIAEKK
jgi:hypothetical protein